MGCYSLSFYVSRLCPHRRLPQALQRTQVIRLKQIWTRKFPKNRVVWKPAITMASLSRRNLSKCLLMIRRKRPRMRKTAMGIYPSQMLWMRRLQRLSIGITMPQKTKASPTLRIIPLNPATRIMHLHRQMIPASSSPLTSIRARLLSAQRPCGFAFF